VSGISHTGRLLYGMQHYENINFADKPIISTL